MTFGVGMTGNSNYDLAVAILHGSLAKANEILGEHPKLVDAILHHPQTTDDTPAIILASSCGVADIVKKLITLGADTETPYEKEGRRPLHIAAQRNHLEVAKVLLEGAP